MTAPKKRRGAGEGAIYRLADGRWRGAVDLGWHDGRRRRRYVTRPTRGAVAREVRRLVIEAEQGRLSPTKTPTVAQWLETYLREVAAPSLRPGTLDGYRNHIRQHLVPALGHYRLDKLRASHVAEFYRVKLQTMAPASVRRLHAVLRRALNVAVRWQVIPANPVAVVDPPPLKQAEVKPFSREEAREFMAAVRGHRLEARWLLGIVCGLRQGEALGLRWDDLDLNAGVLRVRQALQYRPGGGLVFVLPKTARSRRSVPLGSFMVSVLGEHAKRQAEERAAAGDRWVDSGLVFTTRIGTPISPRNDYRAFRALLGRSGLRQVRLHDLRHTAASLMLAQGVSARVIMETLGHSQISVTMDLYSHVAPEVARDAADRVEDALWGDS